MGVGELFWGEACNGGEDVGPVAVSGVDDAAAHERDACCSALMASAISRRMTV